MAFQRRCIVVILLLGWPALALAQAKGVSDDLIDQVARMVAAGHLKPGFFRVGNYDNHVARLGGDLRADYWANPAETIVTLLRALPHLPEDLQTRTRAYVQQTWKDYPPLVYSHVGWRDGAFREPYDYPPDVRRNMSMLGPSAPSWRDVWTFNPYNVYAAFKYAETFGGAAELLPAGKSRLGQVPANRMLETFPNSLNAFIAGRIGYLGLQRLAGQEESTEVKAELDRLLAKRLALLDKDPSSLVGSEVGGFLFLTPELAHYLYTHGQNRVRKWVEIYDQIMPYWFEARSQEAIRYSDDDWNENSMSPLTTYHSFFQARAMVLKQPADELEKYLDVPGSQIGDLYFILNLVSVIEAAEE